jgi:hypothetical protein
MGAGRCIQCNSAPLRLGRRRVPQAMRPGPRQARSHAADDPPDRAPVQLPAQRGHPQEQRPALTPRAAAKTGHQRLTDIGGQRQHVLPAALAQDEQLAAAPVRPGVKPAAACGPADRRTQQRRLPGKDPGQLRFAHTSGEEPSFGIPRQRRMISKGGKDGKGAAQESADAGQTGHHRPLGCGAARSARASGGCPRSAS